jgi:predicted phage-related endonuclease
MKNHKDLLQKSLDWHEIKWGKIGGTLSKGLFLKSDTLLIDILSQRLEEFEPVDSFETYDMQRGNELEPFAKEYLEQYTGIKFEASGWLQCEENELLGISPDGITEDETVCCEIKCLGRKKHLEVLISEEIPNEYLHQCLHYFTVNPKLEKLYFIAYRPEMGKNFIKELNRFSFVNLGTKAKPVIKTIKDWVKVAQLQADELLDQIKQLEEKLKF